MNGARLKSTDSFKYLGVTIKSDLDSTPHIDLICKKATGTLHMLMRSLKSSSSRTRALCYTSICRPILEYGSQAWSPYRKKNIEKLEKIQRKAYRWAFRRGKADSISADMQAHGWQSLEDRRHSRDKSLLQKISENKEIPLGKHVQTNNRHHTRHGVIREHVRTSGMKFSFFNRMVPFTKAQPSDESP